MCGVDLAHLGALFLCESMCRVVVGSAMTDGVDAANDTPTHSATLLAHADPQHVDGLKKHRSE